MQAAAFARLTANREVTAYCRDRYRTVLERSAGLAFGNPDHMELLKTLKADSTVEEVVRNFFIRQPVLWVV